MPRVYEIQWYNHAGNLKFWQSCAYVSLVTRNAGNRLLRMQLNRNWKDYGCKHASIVLLTNSQGRRRGIIKSAELEWHRYDSLLQHGESREIVRKTGTWWVMIVQVDRTRDITNPGGWILR